MPRDINKLRVISARERGGQVEATIEFEDGLTQSVNLPTWATKDILKREADRLRDEAEARAKSTRRTDLED